MNNLGHAAQGARGCFDHLGFAVLMLFALTACQHTPPIQVLAPQTSPCAHFDWFEIGRADGTLGLPASKITSYQERCDQTEFPVKTEQYQTGRETGLLQFCSPTGGLEAGKALKPYNQVCPENLEPSFLSQYEIGRKIHDLENDRSELEDRIANLRRLMAPMSPDLERNGSIHSQIEVLKSRQSKIDATLQSLEAKNTETN
jgi:Protein of unknown function (DUF2799)